MENLCYFAKNKVTLEDIRFVAETLGYDTQLVLKGNVSQEKRDEWLNIIHCYDETARKRLPGGEIVTYEREGYWQFYAEDDERLTPCEGIILPCE